MKPSSMLPKTTALIILFCLTFFASASFAQTNKDKALSTYESAQKAYQEKDYKKAASLLEKAFAFDSDLIYMYNRILALKAAGDPEESLRLLKVYKEPMLIDKEKRFNADNLNKIQVALEKAVADKKANANKVPDKGTGKDKDKDKVVDPGKTTKPEKSNTLGWVLIGSGVPVLITGMVFGADILLDDDPNDVVAVKSRQDNLALHQTIAGVGYAGGIILIGAGIATFFIGGDDDNAGKDAEKSAVLPYVSPNGAGAVWQFRF